MEETHVLCRRLPQPGEVAALPVSRVQAGVCKQRRPHVPLAGHSQDGAFVTASAEHYPDHLCRLLASCFLDLELQLTAESIEYY